MKKRSLTIFTLSGAVAFLTLFLLANVSENQLLPEAKAGATTTYNHYAAVEPSESGNGMREYWVSCLDHSHQFSAPSGSISDVSADAAFVSSLTRDDDRYIPSYATLRNTISALPSPVAPVMGSTLTQAWEDYSHLSTTGRSAITNSASLMESKHFYEDNYGLIFDAAKESLTNREYSSTWSTSKGNDATYGDYLEFSSVSVSADNFSIGPNKSVSIPTYDSWLFYVYVPSTVASLSLTVYDQYTAIGTTAISCASGNWTAISLTSNLASHESNNVRLNFWFNSSGVTLNSGIRISSIYGVKAANKVASINLDAMQETQPVFVTKAAYSAGSAFDFWAYLPTSSVVSWWGVGFSTSASSCSIYNVVNSSTGVAYSTMGKGSWNHLYGSIPGTSGSYYLYFASDMDSTTTGSLEIDDFTISGTTDQFTDGAGAGLFTTSSAVSLSEKGNEVAALSLAAIRESQATFISKKAYPAGTSFSFYVNIPVETVVSWWGVAFTSSTSSTSIYDCLSSSKGIAYTATAKGGWSLLSGVFPASSSDQYLYFCADKDSTTTGYLYIDDFTIGTEKDDFSHGPSDGLFTVNYSGASSATIDQNSPSYASSGIAIAAYGSVPVALMNDTQFTLLKDAGFTEAMGLYEGRVGLTEGMDDTALENATKNLIPQVKTDGSKALGLASSHSLTYYVFNELLYNLERYTTNYSKYLALLFADKDYLSTSSFAGHFLADEPTYDELAELATILPLYRNYITNGKPLINLNPCSAVADESSYKTYLDRYFNLLASSLGYVSFDHYPFTLTSVDETHLWNLEEVANRAKSASVDLRSFLYASSSANSLHRAVTSANDLRFQIYSALAFGSKALTYYSYSSNVDDASTTQNLVNGVNGSTSDLYTKAKTVNAEIHAFEDAYSAFSWTGEMTVGSCSQFSALTRTSSSSARLSSLTSGANLLVGLFSDKDGVYSQNAKDGFLVMNYTDPSTSSSAQSVAVSFNDASRVLVYQGGKKTVVPLVGGAASLSLEAGEGAFLVPFE